MLCTTALALIVLANEPCDVSCQPGDIVEAESCGATENDGCKGQPGSSDPPAIKVSCGDTICGTLWRSATERDDDWFELTVDTPTYVSVSIEAERGVYLCVIDSDGAPICTPFLPSGCGFINACNAVTYSLCCEPGSCWFSIWLSHPEAPCEVNDDYRISFSCGAACAPSECGAVGSGDCFIAHATPGCSEASCCETTCSFDYWCCLVAWDGICASEAYRLCFTGPPEGDTCERAQPLLQPSTGFFLEDLDLDDPKFPVACDTTPPTSLDRDCWFSWTASANGLATVSTCNDFTVDTVVVVYEGSCDALTPVECNDDTRGCANGTGVLTFTYTCGTRYLIRLGAGEYGNGTLTFIASDACNADFDANGVVNGADLGTLLGDWSSSSPCSDLDKSGAVDGADLSILLGAWGDC